MSQKTPSIPPVGYPVALEIAAALLVIAQLLLSWFALDILPSTVIPFFGPGRSTYGIPDAVSEAQMWAWTVIGIWALLFMTSALMYRTLGSSPIPLISVGVCAYFAVMRAGLLSMNLHPTLSTRQVLTQSIATGVLALCLGTIAERFRAKKKLPPFLVKRAFYDERTPRDLAFYAIVLLGLGIPLIFIPTRVRVNDSGLLVITPVSYFVLPANSIEKAKPTSVLQAFAGAGLNFAASPGSAVRIWRKGRIFQLIISVTDRKRFLKALDKLGSSK